MKSPRVALYERVSTDKQEFRSQHGSLVAYCGRQGWRRPLVYAEKDSRANARRTVLNQLLIDARLGKFSTVVVFKIDRMGSRPLHIYQVLEEFRHLKIRFISINDHIDTDDTTGKSDMLIGFMTTMAANELDSIRRRTRAGLEAARKRGRLVGRPPTSRKVRDLVLFLRTKQKKTYAQIRKSTGVSQSTISRIVNAPKK